MATSIVDTLFGVSPERLQQQRAEAADAQALAFARLSPIEKASFGIQRGAYDFAGALGGALGGKDPELQRVTMRQQIAGQIDYNDDASMQQGIIALRDANDPAGALQLQQILLGQQAKRAGISKDEAAAQASLVPKAPPTTNELTNARAVAAQEGPPGSPEYAVAFNKEYQRLTAPKDGTSPKQVQLAQALALLAGPVGSTENSKAYDEALRAQVENTPLFTGDFANAAMSLYGTNDPKEILRVRGQDGLEAVAAKVKEMAKGNQPVTTIINKVSTGVLEGFGKAFQDTVNANTKAGRAAVGTSGTIQNMQTLLDEGVRTGFGQESILQLNRAGQLFDPDFKIKGVAGQEAFQSFATGIILPQVKQLGVNPTDADLKFISSGSPGLSKTVEGNKLLLSALDLKLKREIDLAKFTNQFLAKNEKLVTENPLRASILFNEAFDQYTQTSPLYGPAVSSLRERFNAIGAARSTNPAARSTLERSGLVNPQ